MSMEDTRLLTLQSYEIIIITDENNMGPKKAFQAVGQVYLTCLEPVRARFPSDPILWQFPIWVPVVRLRIMQPKWHLSAISIEKVIIVEKYIINFQTLWQISFFPCLRDTRIFYCVVIGQFCKRRSFLIATRKTSLYFRNINSMKHFCDLPQSSKEKWIVKKKKKIFVLVLLRWFYPRNKAAKRQRKCLPSSFVLTMPQQQPLLPRKEDVKHIPCTIFFLREELLTIYGKMTKVAFLFNTLEKAVYILYND